MFPKHALAGSQIAIFDCGCSESLDETLQILGHRSEAALSYCSLMLSGGANRVVLETLTIANDLELERNQVIASVAARLRPDRNPEVNIFSARRCTFLVDEDGKHWADITDLSQAAVGYIVIVSLYLNELGGKSSSYIFEAIIGDRALKQTSDRSAAYKNRFDSSIGFATEPIVFSIEGLYFCEQNKWTQACMQTSLQMSLNNSSYKGSHPLSAAYLNELLEVDIAAPDSDPSDLGRIGIENIASRYGLVASFTNSVPLKFDSFLSQVNTVVESGFPAFVVLSGSETEGVRNFHVLSLSSVVSVNRKWTMKHSHERLSSRPRYTPSSLSTIGYIVHDDTAGPLCFFPSEYLRGSILISLRPPKALNSYHVERLASAYITICLKALAGCEQMSPALKALQGNLAIRVTWRNKGSYLSHFYSSMLSGIPESKESVALFVCTLPNSFWVAEISTPTLLFASNKKVGEIIWPGSATLLYQESEQPIATWLLGLLVCESGAILTSWQ